MKKPKLYKEDPSHRMPGRFLSEEVYAQAISNMVVVTADVVIVSRHRRTIYLAKRSVMPLKDCWWWIGGRILAGEPEEKAIVRNFKREARLELSVDRFSFLIMQRYQFKDRAQQPHDIGSDCLSYLYTLELTPEELAAASNQLDVNEFLKVGLTEFTREKLVKAHVHEAILDAYDEIFAD